MKTAPIGGWAAKRGALQADAGCDVGTAPAHEVTIPRL